MGFEPTLWQSYLVFNDMVGIVGATTIFSQLKIFWYPVGDSNSGRLWISRRQVSPRVEGIQSHLVAEFSGANAMHSPKLGLTNTPPGY